MPRPTLAGHESDHPYFIRMDRRHARAGSSHGAFLRARIAGSDIGAGLRAHARQSPASCSAVFGPDHGWAGRILRSTRGAPSYGGATFESPSEPRTTPTMGMA